MKQLKCEMCGGTDLIKDGGVFVCQSCGCKYTVEEAKKMMIEGTVDISGSTVKVDTSEKLKNLYTLARRAKESGNSVDAARYYSEIQLEDPNSWEAVLYSMYYRVLNSKIGEIVSEAYSVKNSLAPISRLILDYVPEEKQEEAYKEFLNVAYLAGQALMQGTWNGVVNSGYRTVNYAERINAANEAIREIGDVAEKTFHDIKLKNEIYEKAYSFMKKGYYFQLFPYSWRVYTVNFPKLLEDLKPRLAEAQKMKNEEYWAQHQDKKKELESKKATAVLRKSEIEKHIAQEEDSSGKAQLETAIVELAREFDSLGLFKAKEKKAIQAKIDEKRALLASVEDDLSAKTDSLKSELNNLEKIISELDIELTKDR